MSQTLPFYLAKPVNRQQRRTVGKELERNCKKVDELEIEFLNELFSEENDVPYNELYAKYLELYKRLIDYLKDTKALRYTAANKNYFYEKFHPSERAIANLNIFLRP